MLFVMIPFLLLVVGLWADHRCWCRFEGMRWQRCLLAVWLVLTQLPLPLMFLLGFLLPDNSTPMMSVAMWLFWSWLALVIPRQLFYALRGIGLRRVGWVLSVALFGWMVWGVVSGRQDLRVEQVEVSSPKLPASFDGVRIVQLSDIHVGSLVHPVRELARLVDRVEALHPDMICFTGDLVNIRSTELTAEVVAELARLRAPLGIFSVLGNHDVATYIKDTVALPRAESVAQLVECQRKAGWQLLTDTTLYVARGGDSISLTGLSFDPRLHKIHHNRHLPLEPLHEAYASCSDTCFNLTLAHLPQLWERILETPYGDLTLSGHVHAMQMKISLFGRSFSPAQLMYKRWSGLYTHEGRHLYINDGSGYVGYPMRLGARPEVTLITLRRCE